MSEAVANKSLVGSSLQFVLLPKGSFSKSSLRKNVINFIIS